MYINEKIIAKKIFNKNSFEKQVDMNKSNGVVAKVIPFKKDIFPPTANNKGYRRIKKPQHPVNIHYYC